MPNTYNRRRTPEERHVQRRVEQIRAMSREELQAHVRRLQADVNRADAIMLRRRIAETLWLFEPALVTEPSEFALSLCGQLSQRRPQYIGQVAPSGCIVFPHVDTCLAIAFVFENGGIAGAHVSMQEGNNDLAPVANALALANTLLQLAPRPPISKVIFLGQSGTWLEDLVGEGTTPVAAVKEAIATARHRPDYLYLDTFEYTKGADLVIDSFRRRVAVYSFLARQLPTFPEQAQFERELAAIRGNQLERLPTPR